jgi:hypothetical protein
MPRPRLARTLTALLLSAGALSLTATARSAEVISGPAAKGAQVYCFMRNSGNNHEVSWMAAYALIKRQSASLFKTSPEHAAVMITEAVVQSPGTFPDCGKYLGDLYASAAQEQKQKREAAAAPSSTQGAPATGTARYAY